MSQNRVFVKDSITHYLKGILPSRVQYEWRTDPMDFQDTLFVFWDDLRYAHRFDLVFLNLTYARNEDRDEIKRECDYIIEKLKQAKYDHEVKRGSIMPTPSITESMQDVAMKYGRAMTYKVDRDMLDALQFLPMAPPISAPPPTKNKPKFNKKLLLLT